MDTPAAGVAPADTSNDARLRAESERAWTAMGSDLIDAVLRLRRSTLSRMLESDLYLVDGVTLTPVQVDALECLAARPVWRMHELAARLGVDPSTATRAVDPLVRLELAERGPDPADRRYVAIRARERGAVVARRICAARLELMRAVLDPMPPEDRLRLTELLTRYVELIDDYARRSRI